MFGLTLKKCTMICFFLFFVNGFAGIECAEIFGEELRMLTFKGTAPAEHLDAFKRLVKEKYNIDLNFAIDYVADPGEFYEALRQAKTDIINCPHNLPKDPRYKFISGKLVLPIDLNNVPNYKDIIPGLQKAEYITEEGQVYGVPFTYAPYGLAYNTAVFPEPPETWNIFWDPQYAGKYAVSSDMYELNVFITALVAGIEKSKISDYDAVSTPVFTDKLKYLAKNAKTFWSGVDTAEHLQGLALATGWGFSFSELKKKGEIWKMANPQEGTPGGIGNFMIAHTLRNKPEMKRIAEEWINYVIGPDFQVNVVVNMLSTSPVNLSIKEKLTPEQVEAFHLNDLNYFK